MTFPDGWYILPVHSVSNGACSCGKPDCGSPGKHPRTSKGVHSASDDPKQIAAWAAQYPGTNWALAAGRSGIVVLDVDAGKGGYESLNALEARLGALPETVMANTGGGGLHILFAKPDKITVKSPVNALGKGIDIRADGAYVVIHPSVHKSGAQYLWSEGYAPEELTPAPLPPELLAELSAKVRTTLPHIAHTGDVPAGLPTSLGPVGGQDDELQRLASKVAYSAPEKTPEQLLEILEPTLEATEWEDGPEHLKEEALKKLERALERKHAEMGVERAAAEVPMAGHVPNMDVGDPIDTRWGALVKTDKDGKVLKLLENVYAILKVHPEWAGAFRLNTLRNIIEIHRGPFAIEGHPRDIRDSDGTQMANYFATQYGIRFTDAQVKAQISLIAEDNRYDPISEYLERCELGWDTVPRLDTWLETYMSAPTMSSDGRDITEYLRKVGSRWLISAAARGLAPGCQVDSAIVLEGAQGSGKSSALGILGGEWYSNSMSAVLGSKDSQQLISRVWIQELAELASLRRADHEAVKDFLTTRIDIYRNTNATYVRETPRHCVFAGTTNSVEEAYLGDKTGNRRFWPVACGPTSDLERLANDRDQLWGEAVHRFKTGEKWFMHTEDERRLAAQQADLRLEQADIWATRILEWWKSQKFPEGFVLKTVALDALQLDLKDTGAKGMESKIGHALRDAGFRPRQVRRNGSVCRVYDPVTKALDFKQSCETEYNQ